MNGDGLNTISDLWPFLSAVYNWPGNQVVDLSMQQPHLAQYFEMSQQSCGGWFAFAVSTLFWLFCLMIIGWLDTI